MITLLKNEMKRAIFNKGMLASFMIGLIIVIWHLYQHVWGTGITLENGFCIESVFYRWIGAGSFPMQTYLYYLILPLIAVLPGGISYFEDLKSGYIQNIYTRTKRWHYIGAKYIAVTTAGGLAVLLPLVIDLYLTCMRFPAIKPEPVMTYGPGFAAFGYNLFYTHPWVFTILFLCFDFWFAGALVGLALITTFFTEYRFIVLITPFVCYFLVYSLNNLFSEISFAPNLFLIPGFTDSRKIGPVICSIFLLLISGFFIWKGNRYEAK